MEVEEFEQRILELAFEADARITTASVAYYLGVPSTKAEPMLEELLERGVLELDSDPEGNLYYRVVDAAAADSDAWRQLKREEEVGIDGAMEPDGAEPADGASTDEGPRVAHAIGDATVDESGGEQPAYSPGMHREPSEGEEREPATRDGSARAEHGTDRRSPSRAAPPGVEHAVSRDSDRRDERGRTGEVRGRRGRTADPALAGVTDQQAATDAYVDTCGEDPVVVQSNAQCESRPLADSEPVVASCAESTSGQSTALVEQRDSAGQTNDAPAAADWFHDGDSEPDLAYEARDSLEHREHQPGMSLLLSLILCGTGQIYNGEVSKGIMMMVLCFLLWAVLLGWVVHIWSIVDSVVVAERINRQSGDQPNRTGPERQLSGG